MRIMAVPVLTIFLCACPPGQVPDAGDVTPSTSCTAACDVVARVCGSKRPNCEATLQKVELDRLQRAPDGQPITCARVAASKSKADLAAAGEPCP